MKQWATLEEQREVRQTYLDGLKSAEERNRWGQFSTPIQLAVEVTKLALEYRTDSSEAIRFLDPAFGTGAFLSALCTSSKPMGHKWGFVKRHCPQSLERINGKEQILLTMLL